MFNNIGWGEMAVLLLLALLIFGPERLPRIAAQAGRAVRQFRTMASGLTDDLRSEMGTDFDELRRLHPRRWLDDEAPPTPATTAPLQPLGRGEVPPYDAEAT